jgi:hypothetical protein
MKSGQTSKAGIMNVLRIMFVIGMLLSGCAADQLVRAYSSTYPELANKSSEYKQGFDDGCLSGIYEYRQLGEFRRDEARMTSDTQYSFGWIDGARHCRM